MMKTFVALAVLMALSCAAVAGNIADGSLQVGANGFQSVFLNPTGYNFAANPNSLDLTYAGTPVTLSGTVDLSAAPLPAPGQYPFYVWFKLVDDSGKGLQTVMNTDPLGGWRGIPAQPWDRVRLETNPPIVGGPELYFSTQGGQTDDGGGWIYPSDRIYDFQMTVDPLAQTLSLRVYGKGRTNVDAKQWYEVGTMNVAAYGFDYANTQIVASLWSDVGAAVSFSNMNIAPIGSVPEPASLLALAGGLGSLVAFRRRRA